MQRSPYVVLGLSRHATPADVRAAYRRLSKERHPDRGGSDEAFRELREAYEALSDPVQRGLYDCLYPPLRGRDLHETLAVPLATAIGGGIVERADSLLVHVPAGIAPGAVLRLRGRGEPGEPPGDLLLTVEVAATPGVRVRGTEVEFDLPVTWLEALRGDLVVIPTPAGSTWTALLPAGCRDGYRIELTGQGLAGGALVAVVRLRAPTADDELVAALQRLQGGEGDGLRETLREELRWIPTTS